MALFKNKNNSVEEMMETWNRFDRFLDDKTQEMDLRLSEEDDYVELTMDEILMQLDEMILNG